MTDAAAFYRHLTGAPCPRIGCGFDRHILACVLSIGAQEAAGPSEAGTFAVQLHENVGLGGRALSALLRLYFPQGAERFAASATEVVREPVEDTLLDLLLQCRTNGTELQAWLAAMIARRAQRPNHLWQDLGLRNRGELSELMRRHFAPLARRNRQDMKWKKFLYRAICSDEGFALCAAPVCEECDDFEACFGPETGESLLARVHRPEPVVG